MVSKSQETLVCEIVDYQATVSLGQLCKSCGVPAEWVTLLVDHGVLEPQQHGDIQRWQFAAYQLPRVHTAVRLERDLGLNASGIALALELMDEIRVLRQRLAASE